MPVGSLPESGRQLAVNGKVDKRNVVANSIEDDDKANTRQAPSESIVSAGEPGGRWAGPANYSECYQNQLLLDNNGDDSAPAGQPSRTGTGTGASGGVATSFDPTDKWVSIAIYLFLFLLLLPADFRLRVHL